MRIGWYNLIIHIPYLYESQLNYELLFSRQPASLQPASSRIANAALTQRWWHCARINEPNREQKITACFTENWYYELLFHVFHKFRIGLTESTPAFPWFMCRIWRALQYVPLRISVYKITISRWVSSGRFDPILAFHFITITVKGHFLWL